jgi:hypothetical protein
LDHIINDHPQLPSTQLVTFELAGLATRTNSLTAMTGEDRRLPGVDDIKN